MHAMGSNAMDITAAGRIRRRARTGERHPETARTDGA